MTARALPGAGLGVAGALGVVAVGTLAAVDPAWALTLVVAAAAAALVAVRPEALAPALVLTLFVESLVVGGVTVGRIAGAAALVVLAVVAATRGLGGLRPNALLAAVAAFGLWMIASALWADSPGAVLGALSSLLLAVAYMLAFAVLVRTRRHVVAVLGVFAAGALAFGLVSLLASYGGETRTEGLQGDPNYFAVYQAAALPAVLALAVLERRPGARLLWYATVGVIVLSVASTLSRTGFVALGGVLVLTLLLPARAFFRTAGRKAAYALALVAAVAVAVALGPADLVSRAQTVVDLEGSAGDRGSGRLDLWRAALHGFREEPVLGLGAGNYSVHALDLLQTTPGVDASRNYVSAGRVAHNGYLELLAELGVVGLALFVAVLALAAGLLVRAVRRFRAAGDAALARCALAVLVSLAAFALSALFLSNQLGKLAWTLVGLALALDVMTRRLPSVRGP